MKTLHLTVIVLNKTCHYTLFTALKIILAQNSVWVAMLARTLFFFGLRVKYE